MSDVKLDKKVPRGASSGRFLFWVLVCIVLFAADRYTKALAVDAFAMGAVYPVTSFFNLVLVGNTGSAFSCLGEAGGWQIYFFSILAVVVTVGILIALWKLNHRTLLSLALTLVAAGAVGNMIDRVTLGYVIDFLDFHAMGYHWPAFNVADIWICAGAVGIVLDEFVKAKK
ncbi:MAG: signal peptidase II [Sutterellaceae bacterium]|nr:signal peptidase II [Sutterellaceae bacterium]